MSEDYNNEIHEYNIPVENYESDFDEKFKDEFDEMIKQQKNKKSDNHKKSNKPIDNFSDAKLIPLTPDQTRANTLFKGEPKAIESLIEYNGKPLFPRNIVAAFVGIGGIGKTYFMYQLAHALTSGTNFGPLYSPCKFKVLMILAEDPEDEIQRRLFKLAKGKELSDGLHVYSGTGKVGPLMKYENGNPSPTDFYHFLDQTIANHKGLDLLILDPKSRFYGLNENDNDQATQWISMLERLKEKHKITILFTHHVPKAKKGMDQEMSRGASSLVDGARWVGVIAQMDKKTATKYGINANEYIVFHIPKTNYTRKLPYPLAFKRMENGLFEHQHLSQNRIQDIAKTLTEVLALESTSYSKDELVRKVDKENPVFTKIKEYYPNISKSKDFKAAIEYAIQAKMIKEESIKVNKSSKNILKCCSV